MMKNCWLCIPSSAGDEPSNTSTRARVLQVLRQTWRVQKQENDQTDKKQEKRTINFFSNF